MVILLLSTAVLLNTDNNTPQHAQTDVITALVELREYVSRAFLREFQRALQGDGCLSLSVVVRVVYRIGVRVKEEQI